MTHDTDTETETPAGPPAETEQPTTAEKPEAATDDGFSDADRQKLTAVVKKEREAARAARSTAEQAEARLAEMEGAELRRTIGEEKSLTREQAAFLTGESPEEMAASADALLAAFPARRGDPPRGPLRSGATGEREPGESMSTVADRVLD